MKLMQDVVKTIRSMKLDYLPAKARPEGWSHVWLEFVPIISLSLFSLSLVYLVCKSDEAVSILKEFMDVTSTLSGCSK